VGNAQISIPKLLVAVVIGAPVEPELPLNNVARELPTGAKKFRNRIIGPPTFPDVLHQQD